MDVLEQLTLKLLTGSHWTDAFSTHLNEPTHTKSHSSINLIIPKMERHSFRLHQLKIAETHSIFYLFHVIRKFTYCCVNKCIVSVIQRSSHLLFLQGKKQNEISATAAAARAH